MSITIQDIDFHRVRNVRNAEAWLANFIARSSDVARYIMVSDDPFAPSKGKPNLEAVDMLEMVSDLVTKDATLKQHPKVSIPHSTEVLKPVTKPSEGEFKEETKVAMRRTVSILQKYEAPFVLNIMPFDLLQQMKMDISFAFFSNNSDPTSSIIVRDANHTYTNVFDFWYDTCTHALRKMGAGDLEIVVGKVGWPTDGAPGATPENAAMFYRGLLNKINEGTPLNKKPINVYLETLIDENFFRSPIPTSRHMGIFKIDGTPKFEIDFTGQGRNITLLPDNRITYLPTRYCIYNGTEVPKIQKGFAEKWINAACRFGDCSPIEAGSCSNLSEAMKLSYALNLLYQISGQSKCTFDSLGSIVYRDRSPSTAKCVFPVALIGFTVEKTQ
ncbi:glucosidase [Lithospermum erythrorhizon]|uniref:Glucosidase n=1 Tax=Lithospermum erythrorhizon TaxID=34254 RepID=A0AAV3QN48_LITER